MSVLRTVRFCLSFLIVFNSYAAERPNILFIMTDDHAAHAIGCYSSTVNQTPNLDRLAAQKEEYMQQVVETTQQRLKRRHLEVQPTMIAEAPRPPKTPTPKKGNPPEPARIPEPYPPPDEGSPPQPAVIPEPGPAVIPEPGPQGRDVRRTAEP